ncbi:hypothetical protein BDN70DRAFT_875428 [Pholiota conissans]|uniref:snRNA-activating protein complex subunit 3 n=1 Tax=Pholiota conissans TaxID=109636 RepID=A0A9P6CWQ7_9AGAR|nr:hypothetical protein BDN70DRAFT_875428 [Pholiota conissans]
MNANLSYTIDSLFGPPSDLINITAFLETTSKLNPDSTTDAETFIPDLVNECSVDDVCNTLSEVWSNPTLSAYIITDHERNVTSLHHHTQKAIKASRKTSNRDYMTLSHEVSDLQKNLDGISLSSFRLNTDAVLFMRTPKYSDQNTLKTLKTSLSCNTAPEGNEAILIISIHSKVSWSPSYVNRTSQHAFLSSQTLYDIYSSIPCVTRGFPPDAGLQDEKFSGCVVCIEGHAYSNEVQGGGANYAKKLMQQMEISNRKDSGNITVAPTSLKDTRLSSLSLRVGEPYWLMHQGNCEHFLVIDRIRLRHPLDPPIGYPLTLHIAPPILDLCRACARVPAVCSVVGDIRLGESPCLLCGPCWRNMGPSDIKEVVVIALPEYTHFS